MRFDLVMFYGVISTNKGDVTQKYRLKPQAEYFTCNQFDNQHRKNRSWFVGEGNDNKPAMDRVKNFLLDNNGKYLDIWSGIPDAITGKTTQGQSRTWKHYSKIVPSTSNWSHIFLLGLRTTLGLLTLELFKISPSIKKRFLEVFVISNRLMTLQMKSEENNKDKKKKNKKQKKTKTPMYDEIMESFEIETGANVSNAGRTIHGNVKDFDGLHKQLDYNCDKEDGLQARDVCRSKNRMAGRIRCGDWELRVEVEICVGEIVLGAMFVYVFEKSKSIFNNFHGGCVGSFGRYAFGFVFNISTIV
ncbi:uncharacterized protein EV154DRAFT_486680 [Mucor mucedo]|uniref:uncharacterized protein n=1 Tax=Mucor mucedo TaxID=29922 RepID=UPI00221F5683|nr:uncharacterized protein EV154DRAFT_486680 [Mucor mucedo]KAI7875633.1 hypothetical protein EV154DRAFT_486680 [Mucor mucedo]